MPEEVRILSPPLAPSDHPQVTGDRPTFLNPHSGERITFLATAEETGGESTRMEIRVQPGPADWVGPVHFHPSQEEHFEVVAGEPEFIVAGGTRRAPAGEAGAPAPPGAPLFSQPRPGRAGDATRGTPGRPAGAELLRALARY